MRWPDLPAPVRMRRVALVAPDDVLRDVLVRVAAAAAVEIDTGTSEGDEAGPGEAARRLARSGQAGVGAGPGGAPPGPEPPGANRALRPARR